MSRNYTIRLYRKDETKWHCSVKYCLNGGTHMCGYDYHNGRSTVTTTVPRCRQHAQAFKQKHKARYISNEERS